MNASIISPAVMPFLCGFWMEVSDSVITTSSAKFLAFCEIAGRFTAENGATAFSRFYVRGPSHDGRK
ncbi:MAG: hypothetical protein ACUVYA_09055 [Planctomycetota bacterium]